MKSMETQSLWLKLRRFQYLILTEVANITYQRFSKLLPDWAASQKKISFWRWNLYKNTKLEQTEHPWVFKCNGWGEIILNFLTWKIMYGRKWINSRYVWFFHSNKYYLIRVYCVSFGLHLQTLSNHGQIRRQVWAKLAPNWRQFIAKLRTNSRQDDCVNLRPSWSQHREYLATSSERSSSLRSSSAQSSSARTSLARSSLKWSIQHCKPIAALTGIWHWAGLSRKFTKFNLYYSCFSPRVFHN